MQALIANVGNLNKYGIETISLQDFLVDATSDDGQAILEPKDGLENYSSIHTYLDGIFTNKPQEVSAIVQVENGTNIPGLGGLAVNRLLDQKLKVLNPINSDSEVNNTTVTVYDKNISQADIKIMEQEFGVLNVTYTNSKPNNYNVLVIVGADYNTKEGKKILNEP